MDIAGLHAPQSNSYSKFEAKAGSYTRQTYAVQMRPLSARRRNWHLHGLLHWLLPSDGSLDSLDILQLLASGSSQDPIKRILTDTVRKKNRK